MKNRFEEIPPVEKINNSKTEFSKKKFSAPPKLILCLFFMERRRNTKTKNPITGIVYLENSLICHTKTNKKEPAKSRACSYCFIKLIVG